jgi:transposase
MLLWQEHKELHPQGHQYSQFCHLYRQWAKQIDPVMRQEHRAGEKLFVDYAGQTVGVAVQVVERWILARLRNHQFFSLRQLNETIAKLLVELNNRAFQKLPGCRKQLFESLDNRLSNRFRCNPTPMPSGRSPPPALHADYQSAADRPLA